MVELFKKAQNNRHAGPKLFKPLVLLVAVGFFVGTAFWRVQMPLNLVLHAMTTTTQPYAHDGGNHDTSKPTAPATAPTTTTSCTCSEPTKWTGQAGQDQYIWRRVIQPQNLCCRGIYVEFGARNGVDHSNTWALEKFQGWKGLLAEVDERELPGLRENRSMASLIHGPICPRSEKNVTIVLSKLGGWTGSVNGYGKFVDYTSLNGEKRLFDVFSCFLSYV